jgi:hypothetical protein
MSLIDTTSTFARLSTSCGGVSVNLTMGRNALGSERVSACRYPHDTASGGGLGRPIRCLQAKGHELPFLTFSRHGTSIDREYIVSRETSPTRVTIRLTGGHGPDDTSNFKGGRPVLATRSSSRWTIQEGTVWGAGHVRRATSLHRSSSPSQLKLRRLRVNNRRGRQRMYAYHRPPGPPFHVKHPSRHIDSNYRTGER